jgi:uncharacterized protein (TIGR02145 family)
MKKGFLTIKNLLTVLVMSSSLVGCKKESTNPTNNSTTNGTNTTDTTKNQNTLATLGSGLIDIDGNKYKTVKIGAQEWMAENLKVTRYNDGVVIPKVNSYDEWPALKSGAYVNYAEDAEYDLVYGKLYNGYAVITNKVCPSGWHVPNLSDWKKLEDKVGGSDIAANKLKEKGLTHWSSTTANVTNEALFNVVPGGGRYEFTFSYLGDRATFWTSTLDSNLFVDLYHKNFYKTSSFVETDKYNKLAGMSIRCVKND